MKRSKITIVGAGNVGAACANWLVFKELGDVVLVDIPEVGDKTKGKALDLAQCGPVDRFDAKVVGTTDYAETAGSDVVVITAGLPRKPGMSRDDLVQTNVKIVASVTKQAAEASPNAVLLIVSNPLDAMVHTARKISGFPTQRIVGQAGCLDIARFRTFIAMEIGCSVEDIDALLMGGHGDDMVPLPRYTSVAGIPVTQLVGSDRLKAIIDRTKMGGGEIVKLMGTSAYYAPAAGTIQMVEAMVKDKKRILPCAAYCDKEYGVGGCFVGVPAILGKGGVERVIEVELDANERKLFEASVAHVKELCALADKFLQAG
ncbi:MAG: malate dehydrogenase [Phycisphaerales bacterium]|nr:MAG: malate dehydrogenase [Phycisphaerales bacterium]